MSQDMGLKQYKQKLIDELNEEMNNPEELNKQLDNLRSAGVSITKERLFNIRMDIINNIKYEDIHRWDNAINKAKIIGDLFIDIPLQIDHNTNDKEDEIIDKYIKEAISEYPLFLKYK